MMRPSRLAWLLLVVAGCPAAGSGSGSSGGGSSRSSAKTSARGGDKSSSAASSSGTASSGGSTSSGGAGSSGAGSSGGSTSGGSSVVSGGSSSGSSSGGCTLSSYDQIAEVGCPSLMPCPTPTDCPGGIQFSSQFVDALECQVIPGAAVSALGDNGVPFEGAAATTAPDGTFGICLPSGQSLTVQLTAPLYPITYSPEVLGMDAGSFFIAQILQFSSQEIQSFGSIFPGGIDPSKAVIIIRVIGEQCRGQFAGWSFALTLPDGGPMPDGGYQLIYSGSNAVPEANLTQTGSEGAALFYNIDPTLSSFLVVTAANPDAGSACQPINASMGFTGRVFVSGGAATAEPIMLP